VQQNFDMQALLDRQIDSAQAMTYNEFGILLQTEDPETGELYSPDQFNTINWNDAGTGMLQDAIWANADWLAEEGNDDIAKRFIKASLKGWIYCRDNVAECTEIVVANGAALDALHMEYMMNEINDLIWPSPDGIGMVDDALWAQTVDVATVAGFLSAEPDEGAYTNDYVTEALAELEEEGLDVKGEDFEKVETDLSAAGG
jgi:NitT/TauT family transport system substrate-binding protein